jgi:hypothetical protein
MRLYWQRHDTETSSVAKIDVTAEVGVKITGHQNGRSRQPFDPPRSAETASAPGYRPPSTPKHRSAASYRERSKTDPPRDTLHVAIFGRQQPHLSLLTGLLCGQRQMFQRIQMSLPFVIAGVIEFQVRISQLK